MPSSSQRRRCGTGGRWWDRPGGLPAGASPGTCLDSDVDGADQLLRNADLAMYRAKAAGQGGFARYDPEMPTDG
jgi:GGDEF domain-containing protein